MMDAHPCSTIALLAAAAAAAAPILGMTILQQNSPLDSSQQSSQLFTNVLFCKLMNIFLIFAIYLADIHNILTLQLECGELRGSKIPANKARKPRTSRHALQNLNTC